MKGHKNFLLAEEAICCTRHLLFNNWVLKCFQFFVHINPAPSPVRLTSCVKFWTIISPINCFNSLFVRSHLINQSQLWFFFRPHNTFRMEELLGIDFSVSSSWLDYKLHHKIDKISFHTNIKRANGHMHFFVKSCS